MLRAVNPEMPKNKITFNPESQKKLLKGIETLVDAVKITLGPRSQAVAIAKTNHQGIIYDYDVIDDGVEISKALNLEDEDENTGLNILREAAKRQVDVVGDGTTVTLILAAAIVREAYKQIAQGRKPMEIRDELEANLPILIKELNRHAIPLKGYPDMVKVATISSKSKEVGTLIADTFKAMGTDGVITVETSKSQDTFTEYQKGMQWDRGYASPYFMTDPDTHKATLESAQVLVTDISLTSVTPLIPFLETWYKTGGRFLVIIAPDFTGDVLPTFIQNKIDGKFISLLVKAPSFSEHQKDMLGDIATLVGATYISGDTGRKLEDITIEDLGRANVVSSENSTVISGGGGKKKLIEERATQIRRLIKNEDSEFKLEKLKERLAKLTRGVAVIKVGGQTEVEIRERLERVEDAVASTRSAIEEGVTAGGEVVYLSLLKLASPILKQALKKPFYQLLENSGLDIAEYFTDIIRSPRNTGVNVISGKIVNMIDEGIIDPIAVSINALKNSVSVGIQAILPGATIVPIKEKK